jgi:pSer/pThr/pTyr-binding forkhead associated (FHA) protein
MWLSFGAQTRELRDGEIIVGSGADADWRIATADLMPRHFTLVVHGLNAQVRPSSKSNVVAVNGRQLVGTTYLLNDGDVIAAGSGRFLFSDQEPRLLPAELNDARAFLVDEAGAVVHPLMSRSTTLGRDGSNAIVVRDPAASRFHAEVRREAGGFALHTMGSAGTMLNGHRIGPPILLSDGDEIEIAYRKFRFVREVPAGMATVDLPEGTGETALRNPTLATGRFTVVPRRATRGLWVVVGLVVAVVVVAAMIFFRK